MAIHRCGKSNGSQILCRGIPSRLFRLVFEINKFGIDHRYCTVITDICIQVAANGEIYQLTSLDALAQHYPLHHRYHHRMCRIPIPFFDFDAITVHRHAQLHRCTFTYEKHMFNSCDMKVGLLHPQIHTIQIDRLHPHSARISMEIYRNTSYTYPNTIKCFSKY